MTSNLEKNHQKTLLQQETLIKLEKSFNALKPYIKAQLQTYKENIEHNIRVQNYKTQKEAAADKKDQKEEDNKDEPEDMELRPVDSD